MAKKKQDSDQEQPRSYQREAYRTYRAFEIRPSRLATRPPARCRDTMLIQGQVPRPIVEAARKCLTDDGLATAHVLRWALLEYIRSHDAKLSDHLAQTYH